MSDTPDDPDKKLFLPDIETWLAERIKEETLSGRIRFEEIPDDDPQWERGTADDFQPDAADNNGQEVEIMEVVVRVFRRQQAE